MRLANDSKTAGYIFTFIKYKSDGAEVDVQPVKTIAKQINDAIETDNAPIEITRSSLIPGYSFIANYGFLLQMRTYFPEKTNSILSIEGRRAFIVTQWCLNILPLNYLNRVKKVYRYICNCIPLLLQIFVGTAENSWPDAIKISVINRYSDGSISLACH